MAKTVSYYESQMKHALGGDPDSRVDLLQVLNEALRFLFDYHPWRFRERPLLDLSSIAAQSYLACPSDLGEVLSVQCGIKRVNLTSLEDIAHRRANTLLAQPTADVYVALSFPAQTTVTLSPAAPRLELYPTPNAIETYTLEYRAGALTLAATSDVPNIPLSFERSLTLLARSFICDVEEQDSTHEWEQANAELARLMEKDGLSQQNLGQMEGGAVNEGSGRRVNFTMGAITR